MARLKMKNMTMDMVMVMVTAMVMVMAMAMVKVMAIVMVMITQTIPIITNQNLKVYFNLLSHRSKVLTFTLAPDQVIVDKKMLIFLK